VNVDMAAVLNDVLNGSIHSQVVTVATNLWQNKTAGLLTDLSRRLLPAPRRGSGGPLRISLSAGWRNLESGKAAAEEKAKEYAFREAMNASRRRSSRGRSRRPLAG
jgi:hypothetical protein